MTRSATPAAHPTVSLPDGEGGQPSTVDGPAPHRVGRYVVVERLGAGGMGAVYTAYDPELDRRVALKVLHSRYEQTNDSAGRTRMLREAQAIARVSHPNVVVVHDAGVAEVDDQPQVFLAMERIEGQTLRTWMDALHDREDWRRGNATAEILRTLVQAARGLAAAHAAGIIHRDFKPDNVLIGSDGVVRVADFGLARRVDASETPAPVGSGTPHLDTRVTDTGALLGTPAYMSPEQFLGAELDPRSDQFSFCATAYEALLGVRAFEGETTPQLTLAVMNGQRREPPSQPVLPPRVLDALHRGLSRDRDDRFESMADLLLVLDAAPPERRRALWAGAAIVGLAGAAYASRPAASAEADDPCRGGPERVAEVWNDGTRAALRTNLTDATRPYTATVTDTVVGVLDRYAETWAGGYRAACEATHVRSEQTGTLLDARMACLDRRLAAMRASVQALASDDEGTADRSIQLVDGLPTIARCSDVAALQAAVPPPADPETARRVAEIRNAVETVDAKHRLQLLDEARAQLDDLIDSADDLDYAPLRAELLTKLGTNHTLTDRQDDAVATLTEAIWVAQESGADGELRDAAIMLGRTVGVTGHDAERGLFWLRLAEATARRVGLTAEDEAEILRVRAFVLVEWQHHAEAIEIAEQALAALDRAEAGPSQRISTLSTLGTVYARLGRLPEAERAFREATDATASTYGGDHPQMINANQNLGNALAAQNKTEEARTLLESAATLASTLPKFPPASLARLHGSLGNLMLAERDFEGSYRESSIALKLRKEAYGDEHPLVARTLNSMGIALKGLERYDEALAVFKQTLTLREAEFGADHVQMFTPLDNVGVVLNRLERFGDAVPYFERAFAILQANPEAKDPYRQADHRYHFGRALFHSGVDQRRGYSLVQEALKRFRITGPPKSIAYAEAWIAEHPEPAGPAQLATP